MVTHTFGVHYVLFSAMVEIGRSGYLERLRRTIFAAIYSPGMEGVPISIVSNDESNSAKAEGKIAGFPLPKAELVLHSE